MAQHLSHTNKRSEVQICRAHQRPDGPPAIAALGRLRKDPQDSWLVRLALVRALGLVERLWLSE